MPLTLTPIDHGDLCHGWRWEIADEADLARKVAMVALGQYRHVAQILAKIDKMPPPTRNDASDMWQKMRKSLGSKRKELSETHIEDITRLFGQFLESDQDGRPISRIFANSDFGYRTITVERPERDAKGKVVLGVKGKQKGKPQADSKLRDTENVPLSEDVNTYFKREVFPHAPDAWIDHDKTKIGYEIPFNQHFYVFQPPRPLAEIDADLKGVIGKIQTMLAEVMA